MSKWTSRRDECGDAWNDLLEDQTKYARESERSSSPTMRQYAQGWRDRRWASLDIVHGYDAEDRRRK
jgi:hypothetical protein